MGLDIQQIRTTLDMTQTEFAQAIGVRQEQVSKWETGKAQPSRLAINAIKKLIEEIERRK
jgi:DNA-binding transcriptional regulator YiaG